MELQTIYQVALDLGVEGKDKMVKQAGSVGNPIVIDSSSERLMSVGGPADTSDISADAAPSYTASVYRANIAKPTNTEGIYRYLSSEENRRVRLDFSAGVKGHSSSIVISSTDETEEICPMAYESSGIENQEGSVGTHKRPEQAVTPEPVKMEGLTSHSQLPRRIRENEVARRRKPRER